MLKWDEAHEAGALAGLFLSALGLAGIGAYAWGVLDMWSSNHRIVPGSSGNHSCQ